ncbi:MAG: hypothetical protein ABIB41_03495 [Nitrospirota bacterium]
MSLFDFFSGATPQPKSYKEAYDLSFKWIQNSPQKAIKVIKSIYKQNLPVKEEDISFVISIASLALRPIFREFEIGKNLLKKVVAVKSNDFASNSILFSLSLTENNTENAKKYANNLLKADYKAYIKQMEPCSQSSIPDVSNYLQHTAELYQQINAIFLDEENEQLAIKAIKIAHEISPVNFKDNNEFVTALFENAILQTKAFISKVQHNIKTADQLSLLIEDLISISLAIIIYHLKNNGLDNTKKEVIEKYKEFIRQQSGAEKINMFAGEEYISHLINKVDNFIIYLGTNENEFSTKASDYICKNYKESWLKLEIEKYCNYLVMNIKTSMIHFGIMQV